MFDPDKFLAKTEPKVGGFDPDAFLAKTAPTTDFVGGPDSSIGSGKFGSPFDISKKENVALEASRPYLESLPMVGGVAGGIAGAPMGPLGTIGGGGLGAGAGKALQNYLLQQMGDTPKSNYDLYTEPLKEAATDVAFAGGAGLIGKGISKGVRAIGGLLPDFRQPAKEGAQEIIEAGERLGAKPTKGMLTSSQRVGDIESAMAQKPTKLGDTYKQGLEDVQKSMQGAAGDVLQEGRVLGETGIEAAESVRKGLLGGVEKRVEGLSPIFKEQKEMAKNIGIATKAQSSISKNIRNLEYARISGSKEASFANQIADNVESANSLADIKNLKSYVGKQMGDPLLPGTMKKTAGDIYGKLADLEKRSITRGALESMGQSGELAKASSEGLAVGRNIIKELKAGNKAYSDFSKELQDLGKKSGLGKIRNYNDFIVKVEGLSSEQLSKKFFQPGNVGQLNTFKKQFPEAFDTLRKAHMQDLYNQSLTKGEVSIPKLLGKVKRMSPEAQNLILGKGQAQKIKDIETFYNNMPRKIGPSGTPEGEALMGLKTLDPRNWWQGVNDRVTDYFLKNPNAMRMKPRDEAYGLLRDSTIGRGLLKPAAQGLMGE